MGHIGVTVSGTAYELEVIPQTYQEVDATDFAPRMVTGSPHLSEQGVYLDVGQDDWRHGLGFPTLTDEKGYQYTGTYVDTRHGYIQLTTQLLSHPNTTSTKTYTIINHNGHQLQATDNGLYVVLDGAFTTSILCISTVYEDLLSNGKYVFASRLSGRLQLVDIRQVSSTTGTTTTVAGSPGWTDDIFNGGTVKIISGTGAGQSKTVTDTTNGDTLTHTAWATNPDATSFIVVYDNAGLDANPPNNFSKLAVFGGYYWGIEYQTNYVHWWAEDDASDAEGGGSSDGTAVVVGPPSTEAYPVNLIAFDNQLWVFRPDGAWTVGSDNLAYHTLDFTDQIHTSNFASVCVYDGFLVFPIRNTIYKYRSGLQDITPPVFDKNFPHKMFGAFKGFVARGKFLYCIGRPNGTFAGEEYELYFPTGCILSFDGVGWHKLCTSVFQYAVAKVDDYNLWLDPYRDMIIWYWYPTGGNHTLFYQQLQTECDLPYDNYATSHNSYWYSSWFDLGMPRINKSWASIVLGGQFPTNTSVQVHYRTTEGGSWTSAGTVTADMQELTLTSVSNQKLQVRLNLLTTTTASSPVIEQLILKVMVRPDVLYAVSCDILVSDDVADPNRRSGIWTAAEIRTALKACRDSVNPITLTDIHGDSASAYLASLRFICTNYEDQDTIQEVARASFIYV